MRRLLRVWIGVIALGILIAGMPIHANAEDTYTKTNYPIVLCHGWLGFDSLLGVLDYFYQIPAALEKGRAQVFVTQVSSVNSSYVRGEQLLSQVEEILATTGAAKVNFICHSQGGLDARYVAGVRPDLVASITTVATPHKGSDFGDFLAANIEPGSPGEFLLNAFMNSLGVIIELLSGSTLPVDSAAVSESLTSAKAAEFNERFPDGVPTTSCGSGAPSAHGIWFYSWGGIGIFTNIFDISDPLLALSGSTFSGPNDGLVGQCSSHFGTVLRDDYFYNHVDEMNGLIGLTSPFAGYVPSVYRAHANRLQKDGL
jgi:triacylglycerol lipase